MKTTTKKLLATLLIIALVTANMILVRADTEAEPAGSIPEDTDDTIWMNWEFASEDDCDVKIWYEITSQWGNYHTVDVRLENMNDEKIDNWAICIPANYEIETIWDAKVTEHTGHEYTIQSAEWNQDIAEGGSVSFGMTVKCSGNVNIPAYVYAVGSEKTVAETDYKVRLEKLDEWDGKFIGEITISNLSVETIEDWHLILDGNFEIDRIWDAAVAIQEKSWENEGSNYYEIENPGYNQNIAPGESAEFWFTATCKGKTVLSLTELHELTGDDEFSEEDEEEEDDEPEYVDEFRLDSDSFETREEYEKYLEEHGYTDDALMDLDEE